MRVTNGLTLSRWHSHHSQCFPRIECVNWQLVDYLFADIALCSDYIPRCCRSPRGAARVSSAAHNHLCCCSSNGRTKTLLKRAVVFFFRCIWCFSFICAFLVYTWSTQGSWLILGLFSIYNSLRNWYTGGPHGEKVPCGWLRRNILCLPAYLLLNFRNLRNKHQF